MFRDCFRNLTQVMRTIRLKKAFVFSGDITGETYQIHLRRFWNNSLRSMEIKSCTS